MKSPFDKGKYVKLIQNRDVDCRSIWKMNKNAVFEEQSL